MSFGLFFVVLMGAAFVGIAAITATTDFATGDGISEQFSSLPEFTPTTTYISALSRNGISIDIERRKFAIARTGANALAQAKREVEAMGSGPNKIEEIQNRMKPIVIGFDDIVAAELIRDNTTVHKTNRGSQLAGAAVGGVLLGPVGLIVGGLSGSQRHESKIERLTLRIYTTDLIYPVHDMTFVYAPGGLDAHKLNEMIQSAELWYGRLRSILEMRSPETTSA